MGNSARQVKESEIGSWVVREALLQGTYESFTPESMDRIMARTVESAGLEPGARVLDMGCGTGFFTDRLAAQGYEACGVDISEELLKRARERKKQNGREKVSYFLGDMESLPFKDASFDACFCGAVLHHFPSIERVAAEMSRVTRPGGRMFGVEPNRDNWHVYLSMEPGSPLRYDKNTVNERSISSGELEDVFGAGLGMDLEVGYEYLGMPLEGEPGFWDRKYVYRYVGFIVKKMRGFFKRAAAVVVFNIVHLVQPLQGVEKRSNFLVFTATKKGGRAR